MARYQGDMNSDQEAHGHGTLYFGNLERAEGTFVHNNPSGPMTLYYPTGSQYHGELLVTEICAIRQGRGLLEEWDASTYCGVWAEDGRWGLGVAHYPAIDAKYEGEWLADSRCGLGVWTARDSQYYGRWSFDKPEGYGTTDSDPACSISPQNPMELRGFGAIFVLLRGDVAAGAAILEPFLEGLT